MNPALVGVALAVVLGAVIAGSARNARAAVLGLIIVLVAGPFVTEPIADTLGLAARLVGAVLAGYLLWIAARGSDARTGGSRLGWPSDLFVAAAAAVVGYGSHGLGAPAAGPALAQAAGFAIAALSIAPIANGRDIMRVGLGLQLLAAGAILVRTALGGAPDPLEQLMITGMIGALGAAVAIVAAAARTDGATGYRLASPPGGRAPRLLDARPPEPR